MIIHHELVQGTPEWRKARSGIPTASKFSEIVTPKTLERSKSADAYENRCVAEILLGCPIDDFGGTFAMERGKALEPDASAFYEMTHGVELQHVGFVTNDARTAGCSPDALVISEGKIITGCETKVPGPEKHIQYLLSALGVSQEKGVIKYTPDTSFGGAYEDHKCQVQGNIWICETEYWDAMSFHPEIKQSICRIHRDEKYIQLLSKQIEIFTENVQKKLAIIRGDLDKLNHIEKGE